MLDGGQRWVREGPGALWLPQGGKPLALMCTPDLLARQAADPAALLF